MGSKKGKSERERQQRAAAMAKLYESLAVLYRKYPELPELAELVASGSAFVPGAGYEYPRAIFVGEAPGSNENKQRLPFVGASGRVLNTHLQQNGLRRDLMWITNSVKFWPRDDNGRTRAPDYDEVTASRKFLYSELRLIAGMFPIIIDASRQAGERAAPMLVLLGRTAITAVNPLRSTGSVAVTAIRGRFLYTNINGINFDLYCTYHPAALRSQDIRSKFGQDMAAIAAEIKRRERTGYYGRA